MDKKSFVLYYDHLEILEELTDEQAGQLFKAMYQIKNNPDIKMKGLMNAIFIPFKHQILRDSQKYDEICKKRATSGARGGKAKASKSKQLLPSVSKAKQTLPDTDTGNENVKETIKELFEKFRKIYPGKKRGLATEFDNFKKKNKTYKELIGLLLPAIEKQIEIHNKKIELKLFCPEYKNLATWINQKCWEEEENPEFPKEEEKPSKKNNPFGDKT